MLQRFGFICNPRAGRGRHAETINSIAATLRTAGHEVVEYECGFDPTVPVTRALQDGCKVIVACGGDGTVSNIAAAMHKSDGILGVVPLGTLNHFARDLGIHGIAKAERALLEMNVRTIDAGVVNGRLFVNNSGIGIYPAIVLRREAVRKSGIPKWPAFIAACIRALLNLPFLRLKLEADGQHLARVTPFLFVGNNVYQTEGLSIGTRKRLDAGELGICTARHHGPLGLIRIAFRALLGTVRQDRDFTLMTARNLTVRSGYSSRRNVSLDGEVVRMRLPLEYSIVPRALRVIAP